MATSFLQVANRATTTLASTITADATSLSVASGAGALFPSSGTFHITIDSEILACTSRSSDTLTVTRAQESTSAAEHLAAATVTLNVTAKALSDIHTAVNALEDVLPTSLTDGGVLLGSGTGEITAMSVLADGEMIVGDGTTDPVAESGATLRASIGVGTADSPQFAGATLSSSSANEPILNITNTHADATAGYIKFIKDPGSGQGADNDTIGTITFYGTNAANTTEEYGRMEAYVIEADDGTEAGGIKFSVAENDATMTAGLQILGVKDADGEVDVTIAAGAASTTTVSGGLAVTGATVLNGDVTLGNAAGDVITINGTVAGANAVIFEGATGGVDNSETTLAVVDPNADRTIYLPNQSGYIPVFAAETSSAQISTTVAELNLIAGGTARGTTAIADGDGVLINDGGTMRMTTVQTLAGYLDDEITAMPNLATLAGLTSIGAAGAATDIAAGDVTMYNAVNDGNPTISIGSSSAERLLITTSYVSGGQLLDYVKFSTVEASSTANRGKYIFDVDGTDIVTIDDGGIDIASGKTFAINGSDIATTDTTYTAGDGLDLSGGGEFSADLKANGGLEISSTELSVAQGISQYDVAQFGTGVADADFLKIDGTTVVGRSTSEVISDIGAQASLTFGIANTNAVKIDGGDIADDEYARFTANGLESRTAAEVAADIEGSIDAVGTIASGTWQGNAIAAGYMAQGTTSAKGALEIATTAEINLANDADRAMTPDLFGASNYGIRYVQIMAVAKATDLTVTDGLAYFHVPAGLDGMDLVEVHAEVFTAPVGSTATFEISLNGAATQMLSTNITIDAGETGSDTAATAAVINTSTDDVDTNDLIQINCTQIGSSTAGAGLLVTMGFRIP